MIRRSWAAELRRLAPVVAALCLLTGCSGSGDAGADGRDAPGFCEAAEDYLVLQQQSLARDGREDAGGAEALREFWATARVRAADLRRAAPPEIRQPAETIAEVVAEYDDALAAIDYEIDRLVTDEDPALIDRFGAIDLQASSDAGREVTEYYEVACGELPGGEIELEPVPLDPPS